MSVEEAKAQTRPQLRADNPNQNHTAYVYMEETVLMFPQTNYSFISSRPLI
jgi:hypothetical protein